jgi:hypothetical protein
VKVYIEPNDWWIGYYRGDSHHYVCPLPCIVIRWDRKPPCSCAKCSPDYAWFRVCAVCGNKRCPHAADHRNACTGSNEPGQKGSLYPDIHGLFRAPSSSDSGAS